MNKLNTPSDHDPLAPDRTEKAIPVSTYTSLTGNTYNFNHQKRTELETDPEKHKYSFMQHKPKNRILSKSPQTQKKDLI